MTKSGRQHYFRLFLVLVCCFGQISAQEETKQKPTSFENEYRKIFKQSTTLEISASEYLKNLVVGEINDQEFLRQIELLGSENYQKRQRAEAFLFTVPVLPEKYKNEIAQNSDMEVRYRLKSIFAHRKDRVQKLVISALKSVVEKNDKQVMGTLFDLLDSTESTTMRRAIFKAIRELADSSHLDVFTEKLTAPDPETRLVAATALHELNAGEAAPELQNLLRDADANIRFAVAKMLVDELQDPAVMALVKLVAIENPAMAARANRVLEALSGEEFGRISFSNKEKNQNVARAWAKWSIEKLPGATLNLPLENHLKTLTYLNGNTLIAKDQAMVIELDADKKEVFRLDVKGVLSAEKTKEGNYLLFSYSGKWLREYSPQKKMLWSIDGDKFNNALPLENGNVLVSIGPNSLVREIEIESKKTVWEYKTPWWPNDAFRLENGNTLIAGKGGVIELDSSKKIVWEYKNKESSTIVVAKPTENDAVLIGWTSGQAREISRGKDLIWEFKTDKLSDVFRAPSGNTLFATSTEILEINPEKEVVWRASKQARTASVRQ